MTHRMLADLEGLTPDQAAARLILEIDESDPVQAARLDSWLDQDPAHRKAWLGALEIWASFDAADGYRPLDGQRRGARALGRASPVLPWLLAACAVAAVASAIVMIPWRSSIQTPAVVQHADLETAGERRLFDLPDGSKVTLAPHAAMDLAYTPGERRTAMIRGKAYFDVVHDPDRPFVVQAERQRITVLGTRFEVSERAEGLRVTLLEGRVRVDGERGQAAGASTTLKPGQELLIGRNGAHTLRTANLEEAQVWRNQRLNFEDKPLEEVVAELNRYSVLKLVIDDPAIARLRITGQFQAGDNARFARTLAQLYPVRATPSGPGRLKLVKAD